VVVGSITSTWRVEELALRLEIPQDEVYRRAMTLGFAEVVPGRFPLKSLAALRAQKDGKAICKQCLETSDAEGTCSKGHPVRFLPEPEQHSV
jgi:hypothetical protein